MSDSKIKFIGVTVAVLLHLVLALALTQESIIEFLFPKRVDKKMVTEPSVSEPVISFQLAPKPVVKVQPKPLAVVVPDIPEEKIKQRFNRTSEEQPQGKPNKPKFYGDRNTVAQSDTNPLVKAKNQPSITGDKTRSMPSTASNYQDGEIKSEALSRPKKSPQKEQNQIVSPIIEEPTPKPAKEQLSKRNTAKEMDAGKPISAKGAELADYLNAFNKKPIETKVNKVAEKLQDKTKTTADKEKIKKMLPKARPRDQKKPPIEFKKIASNPVNSARKPGFRPNTRANKMEGSISRRGSVSSIATEASPLGKYKKLVHNSIAKEWYRRIGQHPDLIKPGSLQVQWYVYDNGKVRGINVLQELLGSEIQKGITLQSIATAKIPKMPSWLKNDLSGEPIMITITFQF